jgi:hypothetical protein
VDGNSHHDHKKRDLQVSKKGGFYSCKGLKMGKEGSRGEGSDIRSVLMKMQYIYISSHMCARI